MLNKIKLLYQSSIKQQTIAQEQLPVAIQQGVMLLTNSLINGKKAIVCGIGRSNTTAQLLVANLIHRYHRERPSFPAVLLSLDGTGIFSPHHQSELYQKQFSACANEGDILVILTANGDDACLLPLLRTAKNKTMPVLVISTTDAQQISELLSPDDVEITVSSQPEARMLEQHLFIINTLSELLEQEVFPHLAIN